MSNLVARQNYAFEKYAVRNLSTGLSFSQLLAIGEPILHSNGKIYFSPFYADRVIEFNPVTEITSYVGNVKPIPVGCYGGCSHSNGSLYFSPYNGSGFILKYTPLTGVLEQVGSDLSLNTGSSNSYYRGCVEHPSTGNVYIAPFGKKKIVMLDPVTNITTEIGASYAGNIGFLNPVVVGDWLYFPTRGSTLASERKVMRYNVLTNAQEFIGNELNSGDFRQNAGIVVGDWIYFGNILNSFIMKYNHVTGVAVNITDPLILTSNSNLTLSENGKLYFYGNGRFVELNPANDSFKVVSKDFNYTLRDESSLSYNNKIYNTPNTNNTKIWGLINIV